MALFSELLPLVLVKVKREVIKLPALCDTVPLALRVVWLAVRFAPSAKLELVLKFVLAVPELIAWLNVRAPLLLVIEISLLFVVTPLVPSMVPIVRVPALPGLFVKLNAPLPERSAAKVPTLFAALRVTLSVASTFNPDAVITPACVTLPVTSKIRLRPTLDVPRTNACALVRLISLVAPEFVKLTVPVNALAAFVRAIEFAPAFKVDVPGIINAPVCVIAPPAVMFRLPPLVNVTLGKLMALLA